MAAAKFSGLANFKPEDVNHKIFLLLEGTKSNKLGSLCAIHTSE